MYINIVARIQKRLKEIFIALESSAHPFPHLSLSLAHSPLPYIYIYSTRSAWACVHNQALNAPVYVYLNAHARVAAHTWWRPLPVLCVRGNGCTCYYSPRCDTLYTQNSARMGMTLLSQRRRRRRRRRINRINVARVCMCLCVCARALFR